MGYSCIKQQFNLMNISEFAKAKQTENQLLEEIREKRTIIREKTIFDIIEEKRKKKFANLMQRMTIKPGMNNDPQSGEKKQRESDIPFERFNTFQNEEEQKLNQNTPKFPEKQVLLNSTNTERNLDHFISNGNTEKKKARKINICRICMRRENVSKFVSPCKCTGRLELAHQNCLKEVIAKQHRKSLNQAFCHICKANYRMQIKTEKVWKPRIGWKNSKDKCSLFCLLLFISLMLVSIIGIIVQLPTKRTKNNLKDPIIFVAFLVTCIIVILMLCYLSVLILTNICFIEKVTDWKVLDKENPEDTECQPQKVQQKESLTFLSKNMEIGAEGKLKIKIDKKIFSNQQQNEQNELSILATQRQPSQPKGIVLKETSDLSEEYMAKRVLKAQCNTEIDIKCAPIIKQKSSCLSESKEKLDSEG